MANRETILKCLLILQTVIDFEILERENNPKLGLIPGTVDVWANDLAEISDEQAVVAFAHFRRTITSDFNRKPRPGDILQFVERTESGGWQAAWQEYLARATSSSVLVGFSESQPWSSRRVKAAADACGGLRALAESDVSRRPFIQKAFREAYAEELDREQLDQTRAAQGLPALNAPPAVIQIGEARAKRQAQVKTDYSEEDAAADIARLKVLRHQQMGNASPRFEPSGPVSGPSLDSAASIIQAVRGGRSLTEAPADREEALRLEQERVRAIAAKEGIELTTFVLPEIQSETRAC